MSQETERGAAALRSAWLEFERELEARGASFSKFEGSIRIASEPVLVASIECVFTVSGVVVSMIVLAVEAHDCSPTCNVHYSKIEMKAWDRFKIFYHYSPELVGNPKLPSLDELLARCASPEDSLDTPDRLIHLATVLDPVRRFAPLLRGVVSGETMTWALGRKITVLDPAVSLLVAD